MAVSLACIAISVQSARSTYAYGQLAAIPVSTTQAMFARVGMPAAIQEDAVIASATLTLTQREAVSGSVTVNLRRAAAGFRVNQTTWANQPALTGATVAVTKSSPAAGTVWSFDVTADVQSFVAGSTVNYGWRAIATSLAAAGLRFFGPTATNANLVPRLTIDYLEPGEAPEDLFPGGIVSIAKPTLSFLVAPDTTAVQVQVDPAASATPAFDSGEIATTAGQVDLAATAYAGLAAGATTQWRARSRGGTGLTPWSAWASFSRTAKPTVSITSPATTTDDTSPPIQWSVSGGTQESWRVIVSELDGTIVVDSGRVGSTVTTWTPPKPIVKREGKSVLIEVRVWDNVDRVTTPGDPEYASNQRVTSLTASGTTNPTSVTATNNGISPAVVVSATSAAAPDGWAVIRDLERVYYNPSLPVTSFSWTDWGASPNKPHTYRAARVVNGTVSQGGPQSTVTPEPQGIWLVDPADPTVYAVIWGADAGSWSAQELAITHQPVAGPPIRRVAYRPPLSGQTTGILSDAYGGSFAREQSEAALYAFKSSSASRLLQLVLSNRSIPVNVGDITIAPTPGAKGGSSSVSFNWWQVDDVPWTA